MELQSEKSKDRKSIEGNDCSDKESGNKEAATTEVLSERMT